MKITSMFKMMLIAATAAFLFACGGGGGGGGATGTTVNGVAQAGIFTSGQAVFKGYSGAAKDKEFILNTATFVAADKGKFTANIGSYAGLLKVEVSGIYLDEATQKSVTILASAPMKSAIPSTSVTNGMTVPVTPITDLAVSKATEGGAKLTDSSVTNNNKAISTLFGIDDIVKTIPVASDASALTTSTDNKQKAYTAALVTISQYVAEYAKTTSSSASITNVSSNDLQTAFSAALMQLSSGINVDTTSTTPVVTITAPSVAFNLNQASANAATNSATQALVTAAGTVASTAITTAITNTIASSDPSVRSIKLFKLKISGNLSGTIGAIQVGIGLPVGVTVKVDSNRLTLPGALESQETGSGTQLLGTVSVDGAVLTVGLINPNGFGVGSFAVLYCTAPSSISASDFNLVSGSIKIKDTNGANITGLTITIE